MRNVRTGLIISCPNGYFYHVEGRSSMWMKMVTPFHGTIDATYCGELMIALSNESEIIFHEMIHYDLTQVKEFGPDYNQRGANGFGSSGR
jgi:dUTPase